MKKGIIGLAIVLSLSLLPTYSATPTYAIQGGESQLGTNLVLTLATNRDIRQPWCSMSLLSEDIVITAAHCLQSPNTIGGSLRFSLDSLWVTRPGIDMNLDLIDSRVKVSQVSIYPSYESFYNPSQNDYRSQENDIALLLLKEPLIKGYKIPIASEDEVKRIISEKLPVTIYGYGYQNSYKLNDLQKIDGRPYSVTLVPRFMSSQKRMQVIETSEKSMCPGDSGGPWYVNLNGVTKIVAVNMTGSGCETNPPGQYFADGTLIYPYLQFLQDTFSFFDQTRIADRAEADAKAKAEAEAKAKAEAEAKESLSKKRTITCVKGKMIKKVTAVNPKCPKSYKRK